ncbi:hypothetical protein [Dysgonomonas sp. HGC4]|uniref:hypothetical protein n=1 Tax=Dysgonomonas sp. HGC4 TaxID=1658009 RepID=UPI0006835C81|nr:hypothetical protein [Dysgonomonas sp. HGC4]MBD8349352.1 hypothetical protein [Dysgonomonas sp. HGC4]
MIQQVTNENSEPLIKLMGEQLLKIGFKVGDIINVSFSENQIIISKNKETEKIQALEQRNPSIKKFIDDFELELLTA